MAEAPCLPWRPITPPGGRVALGLESQGGMAVPSGFFCGGGVEGHVELGHEFAVEHDPDLPVDAGDGVAVPLARRA
jgi:hypothetical protein